LRREEGGGEKIKEKERRKGGKGGKKGGRGEKTPLPPSLTMKGEPRKYL